MKILNILKGGKMERLIKIVGPYDLVTPMGSYRLFPGTYIVEHSRAWVSMGLKIDDPAFKGRFEIVSPEEIKKLIVK